MDSEEDLRSESGPPIRNVKCLRFAAHWNFRPRACRPYWAQTKGKVERSNGPAAPGNPTLPFAGVPGHVALIDMPGPSRPLLSVVIPTLDEKTIERRAKPGTGRREPIRPAHSRSVRMVEARHTRNRVGLRGAAVLAIGATSRSTEARHRHRIVRRLYTVRPGAAY